MRITLNTNLEKAREEGCKGEPEAVRVSPANIAMFSQVQGRLEPLGSCRRGLRGRDPAANTLVAVRRNPGFKLY